jgi:hypothetical protein
MQKLIKTANIWSKIFLDIVGIRRFVVLFLEGPLYISYDYILHTWK